MATSTNKAITTSTTSAAHASVGQSARRLSSSGGRRFCLTERDLGLLEFVASHRFVLACHVMHWLGSGEAVAYRRLRGLLGADLLSYRRFFHHRPGCYQITRSGLAVIESPLPRPQIDLRTYRHDIGVVWIYLAAMNGGFGPYVRLLSERHMRSADQRREPGEESFAIPLGAYSPSGSLRIHYPDALLVRGDHSWVALELELTLKSRRRLEAILTGYAGEPRLAHLLYFTDRVVVAAAVRETGLLVGLDERVDVDYFEPAPERDVERAWRNVSA
ncbi:MAG: hypothetical protein JO304_19340 [Solirubrobacterales bacterium]|nr:hypothetical protein [Solirubrobacterales bacterium]